MTLDLAVLRDQIIEAAVIAVNGAAEKTADRARDKAPVRKVFSGGRQSVRFKTASEINADRDLRARLGLGPEILATHENVLRTIRHGSNPKRSQGFFPTGGKVEEYGFATTVERGGRTHPGPNTRRDPITRGGETVGFKARTGHSAAGTVHTDRARLTRNRANTFEATHADRIVGTVSGVKGRHRGLDYTQLGSPEGRDLASEARLTARGRYELRSGRALSSIAKVPGVGTVGVRADDTARLGGSLRESIRVEHATAAQYPVISASVVAGGGRVTYAKYQELGTRHNPAHPFLRPALAVAKDELPGDLGRALQRTLGGSRR